MKTSTRFTALALAAVMTAAPLSISLTSAAFADTPEADAVAQLGAQSKNSAVIKTADEAFVALREIRAARLALLNGETDLAKKFTDDALNNLAMSDEYMKDFVIDRDKSGDQDEYFLPFDTQVSLSEGFVPTPEKQKELMKANEHMANGDHEKAIETLKLARVDVTVGAALIPAKASLAHVRDAVSLMGEKKFYEANLALKAVEDAIVVETYSIEEIPTQGG